MKSEENAPETPSGNAADGGGDEPPRPSSNNGTIIPDEEPSERLNTLFTAQTADATPAQRESVARWQNKDERFYRQVQGAARGGEATAEAYAVMDDLQDLMSPLPENVQVWRGIRNAEAVFGVPLDRIEELIDTDSRDVPMFFATSLERNVAATEFTTPGPYPVLYKITAQAGTPALWVSPLGGENDAYQHELLFPPGVVLRILRVDRRYSVPIVEAEVSSG